MPYVDAGPGLLVPALILMAAALALTAVGVDAALARRDSETLFWVGLTGLLTLLLAVAWAAAESTWAAPWVGLAAVAGSAGASLWVVRRQRRRQLARHRKEVSGRVHELQRRHDAVLLSWSSYELDAWKAVEKPGLADLDKPETKGLMRAMREAASLRPDGGAPGAAGVGSDTGLDAYALAVTRLEEAWQAAEDSAGDGRAA
ncbi:hypothetical protein J2M53_05915 [Arthrobacter sp. zg-ZUI100]|uniref:hypothetical protein n=1 Tax=Arthrobacter jiangjiafuii TaxID=2817475 RepID=UPI001AEF17F4|nr:hypothetical protein [Arthrobacter jiangjiafuii]MBP3035793.1 hypothetical protein [Arthrobacter jiangjiafuii]